MFGQNSNKSKIVFKVAPIDQNDAKIRKFYTGLFKRKKKCVFIMLKILHPFS